MLLLVVAFAGSTAGIAHAGSVCKPLGGGDKLCKTYGPNRCSGGACRKWVNRCEIKRSGRFYCNYEATETRCAGGSCRTAKTACYSNRYGQTCVTTDPNTCRPSGSGYRTCASSTNTCKTTGRRYSCTFDQQYTSCRSGKCKEVKKRCRSGSGFKAYCSASVRKFSTTKPATSGGGGGGSSGGTTDGDGVAAAGGDPQGDSTGVAVATGACPNPDTYLGTPDQVPPGYYDGCPGIDG